MPYADPQARIDYARSYYHRDIEKSRASRRERVAKWKRAHPERNRADVKAWQQRNPEKMRVYSVRASIKHAGVDPSTVPPKPTCCDLCGLPGKLVLDHDHKTGLFRGWIHEKCNFGIGQFGDDPEMLEKAAAYLRNGNGR
jgi:hypothetical protein